jgi:hypothetical protein
MDALVVNALKMDIGFVENHRHSKEIEVQRLENEIINNKH